MSDPTLKPSELRAAAAKVLSLAAGLLDPDERTVAAAYAEIVAERDRLLTAHAASRRPLGESLPPAVRDTLVAVAGEPVHVPKAWVEAIVTSPEFQSEMRQLLQETLSEVTSDLLGKRAAGGLAAFARAGAAVGKGLFGGVADRLDDAVAAAMTRLQRRAVQLATSPKFAKRAGEIQQKLFLAFLALTEGELTALLRRLPLAKLDPQVAPILVENLH
jgi:hypothetical protein